MAKVLRDPCPANTPPTAVALDREVASLPCPVCGLVVRPTVRERDAAGRWRHWIPQHNHARAQHPRRRRSGTLAAMGDRTLFVGVDAALLGPDADALDLEWFARELDHVLATNVLTAEPGSPWLAVDQVVVERYSTVHAVPPTLADAVRALVRAVAESGAWRDHVVRVRRARAGGGGGGGGG